jgi:hypothetical protein
MAGGAVEQGIAWPRRAPQLKRVFGYLYLRWPDSVDAVRLARSGGRASRRGREGDPVLEEFLDSDGATRTYCRCPGMALAEQLL